MQEVEIITRSTPIQGIEQSAEVKTLGIPHAMAKAYDALGKVLKSNKKPVSTVYARYRDVDPLEAEPNFWGKLKMLFTKMWKIDMGMEVADLETLPVGFQRGTIETGKYIQYKHIGPYSKLSQGYKKLAEFAKAHQLALEPITYDIYLNDPLTVTKSELETLVLAKIKES